MAEPQDGQVGCQGAEPGEACLLCGEPTVGTIQTEGDDAFSGREYACCPACSFGVEERELHGLLRLTACGPN